jgi:hypothetical protein
MSLTGILLDVSASIMDNIESGTDKVNQGLALFLKLSITLSNTMFRLRVVFSL